MAPAKYIREVIKELRKVTWPSRQQTLNLTLVVIVVSIIIAFGITGMDFVFRSLISAIIG